jgi:hypothetical protein
MSGLNKSVAPALSVGDTVRVGRRPAVHTVTAVEYVERAGSRFAFYRISDSTARYARADLMLA